MTYEKDKMMLFGYAEKKRFLKELQENFGKDASLECVLQKLSLDEFTGTIKEILEQIDISPSEEVFEENIDNFVEMFCYSSYYWINEFGPTNGINARCVPIDRAVTEEEVKAYLEKLAAEAEED